MHIYMEYIYMCVYYITIIHMLHAIACFIVKIIVFSSIAFLNKVLTII